MIHPNTCFDNYISFHCFHDVEFYPVALFHRSEFEAVSPPVKKNSINVVKYSEDGKSINDNIIFVIIKLIS